MVAHRRLADFVPAKANRQREENGRESEDDNSGGDPGYDFAHTTTLSDQREHQII
jgi:hypothetical protein